MCECGILETLEEDDTSSHETLTPSSQFVSILEDKTANGNFGLSDEL